MVNIDTIHTAPARHYRSLRPIQCAGIDVRTWFLLYSIVKVLTDLPLFYTLFHERIQLKTLFLVVLVFADIFLISTALDNGVIKLAIVEVFSNFIATYYTCGFFIILFGLMFFPMQLNEIPLLWRQLEDLYPIFTAFRVEQPTFLEDMVDYWVSAGIFCIIYAASASIRGFLASKSRLQVISERQDVTELQALTVTV
ncbi:unnamed protein product [Caenorhabditis sp. 36 PRJEB53466]|nr:unnamed protein product [Caenorhabditis sp. 36 PRJEB53466]